MADRAQVVLDVRDAFLSHNTDRLRELIDPNVVWNGNESEDNPLFSGTTHTLDEFFAKAFKYTDILKKVEITVEHMLTDGNVVMTRQRDDITRADGSVKTYWFNIFIKFNDKDQICEVWEATTSDWKYFP